MWSQLKPLSQLIQELRTENKQLKSELKKSKLLKEQGLLNQLTTTLSPPMPSELKPIETIVLRFDSYFYNENENENENEAYIYCALFIA